MRRVVYLAVLAATLLPAATGSAESVAEKRVAQQIGSHLKQSGQLQNYRVGVKYHDGVAYLNGSVSCSEQRDIAVRLAQQVEGVSHVVCKLEIPNESESETGKIESGADTERHELSQELDTASYEGAQNDSAEVMQAFQQTGEQQAAPIRQISPQQNQQNQMMQMQRQAARMPAPQQMRRSNNNMPVPYQRMPGMMPVRQASASTGVNQAACSSCNGGGGMGMGPGMMGPGGMGPGGMGDGGMGGPTGFVPGGSGGAGMTDNPQMPGYAWPSYASYPNYAALSYPQQYSPTAWPYIGPFYPYPQVPLAWRKVSLEWDDGWWFLDFSSHNSSH
jgi:hypothetical protein